MATPTNFDVIKANTYIGLPQSDGGNNNSNSGGKVFYVNNATTGLPEGAISGSNNNSGLSPLEPFATADYAVGLCSSIRGDKIYLLPGHAETYSSAGALALDVANVEIIGVGVGDNRPTFTFSNTAATIAQSGNGTKLMNVILVPSVDSVVSPLVVTGDGCEFDVTIKDASDTVEFVRGVLATGADRLKGKIEYHGRTGGDACVNAVRLVGCAGVELHVDLYGKASTAWVEYLTTACTNVTVDGYMYNSGTTNGSKNVIDTVTGSTWAADVFDGAAGARYSGGSGSALASDDVSSVASVQENVAVSATAVMVNGNTIFTIAGGPIQIISLVSECVTANDATASTIQYSVTPTTGSAQTISGASGSIANATAGASITLAGTSLATAALYNANGPNLIANPGTIYAPIGTIKIVVGTGSTTGTWRHRIRYKPLATTGVTVS